MLRWYCCTFIARYLNSFARSRAGLLDDIFLSKNIDITRIKPKRYTFRMMIIICNMYMYMYDDNIIKVKTVRKEVVSRKEKKKKNYNYNNFRRYIIIICT